MGYAMELRRLFLRYLQNNEKGTMIKGTLVIFSSKIQTSKKNFFYITVHFAALKTNPTSVFTNSQGYAENKKK